VESLIKRTKGLSSSDVIHKENKRNHGGDVTNLWSVVEWLLHDIIDLVGSWDS
jgi:hypothetical protein